MSEIYKYEISHAMDFNVPAGKVLLAGRQGETFYCWVLVDSSARCRVMRIYATGARVSDDWEHVYSFQDGAYVWHVFENTR